MDAYKSAETNLVIIQCAIVWFHQNTGENDVVRDIARSPFLDLDLSREFAIFVHLKETMFEPAGGRREIPR